MYVAHSDIPKQYRQVQRADANTFRHPTPRDEEGFDDIAHCDGEAESGDDGHHALPNIRDVLQEHQSKTGVPRPPHPEALMRHAKVLGGWNGLMDNVDEVRNVQPFLFSVSELLSTIVVSLLRMMSASLRALLAQGNASPRWRIQCESEVSISV